MRNLLIIIPLFACLLASCSFNKLFLHPTKVPSGIKQVTYSSEFDTTVIAFDTISHQPHYLNGKGEAIEADYTIESVNILSENGNMLNGWFLKPKNQPVKVTVLHLHGNAGFLVEQIGIIAPLVKDGFQILMVDYSGFGFSKGKASRKNVLIDANSAFAYLQTRPEVAGTKLVIYGQSLGGHVSAVVAEQHQSEIDGLIMEGAFSSHHDIAAETAGVFGRIFVREMYSAKKSVKKFRKPILIIHSKDDEVIPYFMGEKLAALANEPKEFYPVDKEHICANLYYSDSISSKILRMLSVPE